MSDSDDTDVLLLIPPDFFLIDTQSPDEQQYLERNNSVCYSCYSSSGFSSGCGEGQRRIEYMSSHHYHLPHDQQSELDGINSKLLHLEKSTSHHSDISSISNSNTTVRRSKQNLFNQYQQFVTTMDCNSGGGGSGNYQISKTNISPSKFVHSTPKLIDRGGECSSSSNFSSSLSKPREEGSCVLKEIDKFLDDKKPQLWSSDDEYLFQNPNLPDDPMPLPKTVSNEMLQLNTDKANRTSEWMRCNRDLEPIISLSDIWENKNFKQIDGISFQEERLRRQHCEKTIQALQSKLLEYQQKISVAIQVDRTKDVILNKQQEEISCLKIQLQTSESKLDTIENQNVDLIERLKADYEDIKLSKDSLDKELAQALGLASKFQDKNEILEIKVESLSKATNDISAVYKKQVDDLELKLANCQRNEEATSEELRKTIDRLSKSQNELEKTKTQLMTCKKQLTTLQNEKQTISEKIKHQTDRADSLDKRNKNLSNSVCELSTKEKNLLKEIESQRNTLKTHYQNQLEKVVQQKLIEFQAQLDTVENNLNTEAKQRERLLADRAIKQLELINEKNEQEISLIMERHNEEIELYRLQLINASQKIADIEEKLNLYRNRRVDIAEKLHTVMETQWQKALEILTSPSNPINESSCINTKDLNPDKLDGINRCKPENEFCDESLTSSRFKTYRTSDRLQAYIEMLLNKSPRDLDNLREILAMPKNQSISPNKTTDKSYNHQNKPPWK